MFNIIAEEVRPYLPNRDMEVRDSVGGRKPVFDYIDITALGLRYFQVQQP